MNRFLPRILVAWTVLAIASPVAFVFLGTACNAIFVLEERFPFPPEAGAAGAGGASACEPGAVEDCYAGPADTGGHRNLPGRDQDVRRRRPELQRV